jgi:hypothetical protein
VTPNPTSTIVPTPTLGPDECNVCDGARQCRHPGPCGDVPYHGSGLCAFGGPGSVPGQCRCRPFECNYCDIRLNPVPAEVNGATVTVSGDAQGYRNAFVNFEVRGGAEPVFGGSYSVFSIDVPLNPGDNQLTVIARAQGPPACWNQYGPIAVRAPNPLPPTPTPTPQPGTPLPTCVPTLGVASCCAAHCPPCPTVRAGCYTHGCQQCLERAVCDPIPTCGPQGPIQIPHG